MTAAGKQNMSVSLVIPLKNESETLAELIGSIERQTFQPAEIVLVDGGSTDSTVAVANALIGANKRYKLIKTPQASPGRGRNIGAANAANEWIAFTDAGIKLETNWLAQLMEKALQNPQTEIIYGNYAPIIGGTFDKIAALAYVPPLHSEQRHRGKSIASCLLKKKVWETVGGFPDLRASEDLIFMEQAETLGFKHEFAPAARVYWQLRPDVWSTFRKFVLYSKYNVWAGKQAAWHYGVAKQYAIILPFVLLTFFHSPWWLLVIALWLLARTAKRISLHRGEHGFAPLFNPVIFLGVLLLALIIDAATFVGWGQALLTRRNDAEPAPADGNVEVS